MTCINQFYLHSKNKIAYGVTVLILIAQFRIVISTFKVITILFCTI